MAATSNLPLISLKDVTRVYGAGDAAVKVLRGISFDIHAGEFVAIMGASGSGKSTLMNIIGLLDRPTEGQYLFSGQPVAALSRDERAAFRCNIFGFVFQQYNLISTATALGNVEAPAVYAGLSAAARRSRAEALLVQLGLGERFHHKPTELSGGQQQRVSIARALMNGGSVILADEPTGALDTASGRDVMDLLARLAEEGHTIILITHDRHVAEAADRLIEVADGAIVADSGHSAPRRRPDALQPLDHMPRTHANRRADMVEAVHAARHALFSNPVRSFLTLLGIIIGVASVIALLGVGEGARKSIMEQTALFGTNRLYVRPGGQDPRGRGGVLTAQDAAAVSSVPNVAAAMPYLTGQVGIRFGNVDIRTTATAVTSDYPRILNWDTSTGSFFTSRDESSLATVAVIGEKVRNKLFPAGTDPLGRFILVNNVPFQVIGVLSSKGAFSGDSDDDDTIAIPFSTGSQRIFGTPNLSWISVLLHDAGNSGQTVKAITDLLRREHHMEDFTVYDRAAAVQAQSRIADAMTLLLGFTAAISLLVGGIGVMNIMLTTVSERTREIGIRMATGAQGSDIMRQFLTEAILLAAVGGVTGLILGHLFGLAAVLAGARVIFTLHAALAAFFSAGLAGLVFGYMPARRAARLDPVIALARA